MQTKTEKPLWVATHGKKPILNQDKPASNFANCPRMKSNAWYLSAIVAFAIFRAVIFYELANKGGSQSHEERRSVGQLSLGGCAGGPGYSGYSELAEGPGWHISILSCLPRAVASSPSRLFPTFLILPLFFKLFQRLEKFFFFKTLLPFKIPCKRLFL